VISGAAATSGLNAKAAPHNPAPTATSPMLTRSKILIDVDSFIRTQTFRLSVMQQSRMPIPKSLLDDLINYQP
jgi:hypothetical protein